MDRFVYIILWMFFHICTAQPTDYYVYYDTETTFTYPVFHKDTTDETAGGVPYYKPTTENTSLNESRGNQSIETDNDGYILSDIEITSLNEILRDLFNETDVDGYIRSSTGKTSLNDTNVEGNLQFGIIGMTGNDTDWLNTGFIVNPDTGNDNDWLNTGFGVIPDSGNDSNRLNTVFESIYKTGNDSPDNLGFEQPTGEDEDLTETTYDVEINTSGSSGTETTTVGSEVNEAGHFPGTIGYYEYSYHPWSEYTGYSTSDFYDYYQNTDDDDSGFSDSESWATYENVYV